MVHGEPRKSAPALGGIVRDGVIDLRVDGLAAEIALAMAAVAVATGMGWMLRLVSPDILPSGLLFPAILLSSLIGGWRSGVAAGLLGLAARTYLLRPRIDPLFGAGRPNLDNLAVFVFAAAGVIAIGAYVRFLLASALRSRDALNEHSLHYSTLFETIPEGFAVCEAIRDASGRLVDYTIIEINPALRRLLGVGPEAAGSRLTESPRDWTRWLQVCDRVLTTGEPLSFERFNRGNELWHEVHLSRLTETRMAQFFFDITERKANEARQTDLFEELNHRVKNNLAMVAGLLQLQARGSREEVRDELTKAAARVQSIAEVHAALSRGAGADTVDFGAYLRDLCANLERSLIIDDGVALAVESESANLPVDAAIPLGMVVNELVTNAVKYAYPDGGAGPIAVGFKRVGRHMLLSVRDEGQGLPEAADHRQGGLGMRLVHSFVEQVGGELTIREGPGAWFEIKLKSHGAAMTVDEPVASVSR
ncbi:MAG TPA: histidine kinase dimerization/phosphoacceptor domain -containing protein [Caulobacteraceae bacterium]